MGDAGTTRPSLLLRLRNPADDQAWTQFVDLYAPLVYGYARRQGLQDADAADLTQDVLRAVSQAIGKLDYDPARGSFRAWLFTVVRTRLSTFWEKKHRECAGSGDTTANNLLRQHPAPDREDEAWRQEHQRRLFQWAAEQVRGQVQESSWKAFWQTAIEGRSGAEVAGELGMSVAAVYLARSRIMARIRETLLPLQET